MPKELLFSQNANGWGAAMHGSKDDRDLQVILDGGLSARELNYLPPEGQKKPVNSTSNTIKQISRKAIRSRMQVAA